MRAGGLACVSQFSNLLTLFHLVTKRHQVSFVVSINCHHKIRMLDHDHIAIAALHAGKHHHSIQYRIDGCSRFCSDVYPLMRSASTQPKF